MAKAFIDIAIGGFVCSIIDFNNATINWGKGVGDQVSENNRIVQYYFFLLHANSSPLSLPSHKIGNRVLDKYLLLEVAAKLFELERIHRLVLEHGGFDLSVDH